VCRKELPEGVEFELEVDALCPLPEKKEKEEEKLVEPASKGLA
jgi:hypothetical protein